MTNQFASKQDRTHGLSLVGRWLLLLFLTGLFSARAFASDPIVKVDMESDHQRQFLQNKERALAAIQFMNHLNYVVYTLSSYKNVFVLEDEYKKLSLTNLDLQKIPDDETNAKGESVIERAILDMMDRIKALRVEEKRRERFLKEQERRAQAAKEKMWTDMITGLIANGVPAGRSEVDSTSKEFGNGASKTAVALAMSVNVPLAVGKACAGQMIGSYLNYQRTQAELQRQTSDFNFTYDEEKNEALHLENKKQLDLQYKLTKRFGIDDREYRITTDDAEDFVKCVKGSEPEAVYTRLKHMLANNRPYNHFPMFWCYYSAFALQSGHLDDAIMACDHFEDVNKYSIFRSNHMAAQVAMTKITAMIEASKLSGGKIDETKINKDAIAKALAIIKHNNHSSRDVDMAYFCATTYSSVLHDPAAAIEVLKPMIYRLEEDYHNRLVKYSDLLTEGDQEVELSDSVPAANDLFRCHLLMKDILTAAKNESLRETLIWICSRATTASLEKLYLMGDTRIVDLWKKAKDDISAIVLQYEKKTLCNEIVVYIPFSWFALGEMDVSVELFHGKNKVNGLTEKASSRRMSRLQKSDRTFVKVAIPCRAALLKGVDTIDLKIPHKNWPVTIKYAPMVGADIEHGEFVDDVSRFIPMEVLFMGERHEISYVRESGLSVGITSMDDYKDRTFTEKSEMEKLWSMYKQGNLTIIGLANAYALDKCFGAEGRNSTWLGVWAWPLNAAARVSAVNSHTIVLPYVTGVSQVQTNSLLALKMTNDCCVVSYTNSLPSRFSAKLTATFCNQFGAQICEMSDDLSFTSFCSGESWMKLPNEMMDCCEPKFILLTIKKERGIYEKARDRYDRWKR